METPDRAKTRPRAAVPDRIACIGLGFVGYHSAVAFCESGRTVVGIDTDDELIRDIRTGDHPFETNALQEFIDQDRCDVTAQFDDADDCTAYVISVPTPVDDDRSPDLSALRNACRSVSSALGAGDLVVIQSTVYPGCTRDELLPLLERSGLDAGTDFGISHVPERYSPGDERSKTAPRVVGSIDDEWRDVTTALYQDTTRSTVPVSGLEVAETIKLVENIQRDVNIAIVNELATAMDELDIDVWEVIEGADTKWNFHRYEPRLGVGGHCLPIDSHYFRAAVEQLDTELDLVTTARDINRSMPAYYGDRIVDALESIGKPVSTAEAAVLGVSYKPNVEDTRNSPALALIRHLREHDVSVSAFDPQLQPNADVENVPIENGTDIESTVRNADVAVVGAGHDEFQRLEPAALEDMMAENPLLVDLAHVLDAGAVRESELSRLRMHPRSEPQDAAQVYSRRSTPSIGRQPGEDDD